MCSWIAGSGFALNARLAGRWDGYLKATEGSPGDCES